ncbi:MAG: ABC transporter ATP-binding protein [Deltaproteobacteria bacterium]|uniref:ABC transporter ATP-binding protein n=1 Tax=Desulfobacula sp. TaxID=2593537 RepID=UPI00199ABD7D|nr:ABC transporter ATP-binding protein [Candidatus Desulfobacula maris]MBL6993423.1 ABC transporter ATP-binding protein [Desulfobacula sp.]
MALLKVENLSVGYKSKKGMVNAVNNISFSIEQGRSLGFVGESGCGKTTIGMTLMGLLPENASILKGDIIFNGNNLASFNDEKWRAFRGKEISMIFQAAMNALNPVIRVDEQIAEVIQIHNPAMSKSDVSNQVKKIFSLVEIPEDRLRDFPHQYSGGMKQRAIIAMALACAPKLIIADEPTTALDVIVQDQILKEIKKIQKALNTSVIFISHDIAVVADVCKDICVMYGGHIVEKGTREEVFKSPRHPYTKTLLGSYLTLDSYEDINVPEIREAPDLITMTGGCRFSANCNCKSQKCQCQTPEWVNLSSTHQALCFEELLNKDKND